MGLSDGLFDITFALFFASLEMLLKEATLSLSLVQSASECFKYFLTIVKTLLEAAFKF